MLQLTSPVQYVKGVGPKRAELLEKRLGIFTVGDLLRHMPRAWEDRHPTPPGVLPQEGPLVLKGKVLDVYQRRVGPYLTIFGAALDVPGHGEVNAVWFKRPNRRYDVFASLAKEVAPGAVLWVVGRGEPGLLKVREINVTEHYRDDDPRSRLHVDRLVPVYPATEGLSERTLREIISNALDAGISDVRDFVPAKLLARHRFPPLAYAVRAIHRPGSTAELEEARRRLAYEELFLLGIAWSLKHRETRLVAKDYSYELKRSLLSPFRAQLGFELTRAQKRVTNEIFGDLQSPHPMTRLLQGDVGSGKTVVAIAALLLAVENGYQGAFMAPTEILAEQHLWTFQKFLRDLPVRVELLTSRLTKRARERVLSRVKAGEVDILLGTHALLEERVEFKDLRLIVIDEQHRFGVRQRGTLRRKGPPLDLLVMTATPIPRTLSMALYGDLDVSTIDEMPPGRRPALTRHVPESEAFALLRREVEAGHQAYVVYPIIQESSTLDLKAVESEYRRMKEDVFKDLRVAMVHGRLKSEEKIGVMEEFADGRWDVLVATPVIEVGVDVPNATVMVVQNADRFGLASLHQLRGRIGRGQAASYCCLVASPKTPEARRRVSILCETADGFRIGEEDLKIRGPGEILGTAQHGDLSLKAADLMRDTDILAEARADAQELLDRDPDIVDPAHDALRERIVTGFRGQWDLIDLA